MALPVDYDSPQGEADAEAAIRQAIADCFLASGATDYGFTSNLVHARPRYPKTNEGWLAIGTIEDPDTEVTSGSTPARLTRYLSVKFRGFKRTLQTLTIRYDILLNFGFKDEYLAPSLIGKNSHDEMAACIVRYQKYLADNLNLGLDDRVTHTYLDMDDNTFAKLDTQGNAAETVKGRLEVKLNVC